MTINHSLDIPGYLARLGFDQRPEPTVDSLFALQRAHVERITYENLEIHLGHPTSVDALESAARIVRGRGGYCFHLNGAFAALLDALGYDVTLHEGEVRVTSSDAPDAAVNTNHMVLIVRCGGESWFVDGGLGDAIHEPLPLRAGEYRQGPFSYGLAPWPALEGGWWFTHDPAGSFTSMKFTATPVAIEAFAPAHERLSTSPESSFVNTVSVGRRGADVTQALRGRVLTVIDAAGKQATTMETSADWFACLAEVFDLPLTEVDEAARAKLWQRVCVAHEAWLAAERQKNA